MGQAANPFVIGVTGGIGSGKTAATDAFIALGINVVDADLMSREVVKPGKPALAAIAEHFGQNILQADGWLDRKALREVIFHDASEKKWLESLLHPLIRQEIITRLQSSESPYTLLSSPLLLETDQHKLCNRVLLIDAPEALQLQRTLERDHSSADTVRAIMASQFSRQQRLDMADDVIVNDTDLASLHNAVLTMHEKYLELSTQVN